MLVVSAETARRRLSACLVPQWLQLLLTFSISLLEGNSTGNATQEHSDLLRVEGLGGDTLDKLQSLNEEGGLCS